jgi:hypothetical protein
MSMGDLETSSAAKHVKAYLAVVNRIEPDITALDRDATLTPIAISLRRIADALNEPNAYGEVGTAAISGAILRGLEGQGR